MFLTGILKLQLPRHMWESYAGPIDPSWEGFSTIHSTRPTLSLLWARSNFHQGVFLENFPTKSRAG